jgi:hypothetical protein
MPDWNAKKPLGIFPGSDYVPFNIGAGSPAPKKMRVKAGILERKRESPPRAKGSKTQVPLSAMALKLRRL